MPPELAARSGNGMRTVASLARWDYFPIAFLGRLPFAMTTVGVLALVVAVRGSIAEGGLASAASGVATAVLAPLIGGLADRHGQRGVLLGCSLLTIGALALLLVVVYSDAPPAAVAGAALLVGGCVPQVGPFSRSRMAHRARGIEDSGRTVSAVMSVESVADEASFVLGPVLVGALTTLATPWAPLALSAALTAIFPVAFALHPSGRQVPSPARTESRRASVLTVRIAVLVAAMTLVGAVFGATLTALTGFMEDRGAGAQTGIIYGAMSVGAIAIAIVAGALPRRFALPDRWLTFTVLAAGGVGALILVGGVAGAALALLVAGCGVGAVLVTLFSIGAAEAPAGRTTTVLTVLQSSLTVGQALVLAVVGLVVERAGSGAGFLLALAAVGILGGLGIGYRLLAGPSRREG